MKERLKNGWVRHQLGKWIEHEDCSQIVPDLQPKTCEEMISDILRISSVHARALSSLLQESN